MVEKLTKTQRKVLIELVGNKCQRCNSTKNLEVHRIKRGSAGGKYVPNNCLILCDECHKELHGEFK